MNGGMMKLVSLGIEVFSAVFFGSNGATKNMRFSMI
jgi:hypothetical protein